MSDSYNDTQRVSYHERVCFKCGLGFPESEPDPPVKVDGEWYHDWCAEAYKTEQYAAAKERGHK